MDLFKASEQWANRPVDERFWTVEEMYRATKEYAGAAVVSTLPYNNLRLISDGKEMKITGNSGQEATLTHYAFDQVCARAGAPANFLRRLPAKLAEESINVALSQRSDDANARLLFHKNGGLMLRCLTGEGYQRIWNHEVTAALADAQADGWKVPPARPSGRPGERTRIATAEDCAKATGRSALIVKPGDTIAPAGLYASDRDMFAFMVDDDHVIENKLAPHAPLARGFFVWNSEVGDKVFGVMRFLYDFVCGNHIVWGAQDVQEIRIRHVGTARDRAFAQLKVELRQYAESSSSEMEEKITRAQTYELGANKTETLAALFAFATRKKLQVVGKGMLESAYAVAEQTPRYGNPNTPWAISQGLTQLSQDETYAERRVAVDRDAGKILEIAF